MDNISTGISVTVIGMGIVFAVLILLWIVLELMRIIFDPSLKRKNSVSNIESIIETPTKSAPVIVEKNDEDELVAVITAAIAASLGTSTYNLKIASIRRTDEISPIWNRVGRQQIINKSL